MKKIKISRKKFIQKSFLAALVPGLLPGVWGYITGRKTQPEKRALGKSGIKATTLGIGASRTQQSVVLKYALDQGITFIDTGRRYANGKNEEMIGETLKGRREQYIIQSKMKVSLRGEEGKPENIREQMETSLKDSLKALQTEYIDIMLLHGIEDEEYLSNETIREVFSGYKKTSISALYKSPKILISTCLCRDPVFWRFESLELDVFYHATFKNTSFLIITICSPSLFIIIIVFFMVFPFFLFLRALRFFFEFFKDSIFKCKING